MGSIPALASQLTDPTAIAWCYSSCCRREFDIPCWQPSRFIEVRRFNHWLQLALSALNPQALVKNLGACKTAQNCRASARRGIEACGCTRLGEGPRILVQRGGPLLHQGRLGFRGSVLICRRIVVSGSFLCCEVVFSSGRRYHLHRSAKATSASCGPGT